MKYIIICAAVLLVLAAAVTAVILMKRARNNILDGPGMEMQSYRQISQDEAKKMMARDDGHVVVDVRRIDEYEEGHIPGAICIPNESIEDTPPAELHDLEQIILIYCRSGRRSKDASQKLFDMGYKNVYEFGGIIDWTGETVKGSLPDVPDIESIKPRAVLVVESGGRIFYAHFEENSSSSAFRDKLNSGAITVEMSDYGGFEKVGDLPWELPQNDEQITTKPGDIILYRGDKITIYYGENTWNFTRLASIGNTTKDELLEVLGEGDATVTFSLEWSE